MIADGSASVEASTPCPGNSSAVELCPLSLIWDEYLAPEAGVTPS